MTARTRAAIRNLVAAAVVAVPQLAIAADGEVWKNPNCGCCIKWVEHMAVHGHALTPREATPSELDRLKARLGLKREQSSCHTALIGGYVIEGHVPAADVSRLLVEKPEAIGLAVPDMPAGAPGMDEGGETQPYDVLLVRKDGSSEVFSRY